MTDHLLVILGLIAASAFFSMAEIALAASRRLKLQQLADTPGPQGERAVRVLQLQAEPGYFFTVVQIGVNAVAILGGIVGEGAFSPVFAQALAWVLPAEQAATGGFVLSFALVTSLFILFADLVPKRLAMIAPEAVALRIVAPMGFLLTLFRPLVWLFSGLANLFFRVFDLPTARHNDITQADIVALASAGAQAGVLDKEEHALIENVFELESRTVPSSMTPRESVVFFTLQDSEASLREKIAAHPHGKYPVCDGGIDRVIGYVDGKDLLLRALNGQPLALKSEPVLKNVLIIPDTLTLSEVLKRFKAASEDFALIMNEYALVVGLITLEDVISTVMGDLVSPLAEEQIVRRDADSWLIDGITPVEDVMRALSIDDFPETENYETIAGFMMYTLRKIPRRTDAVTHAGFKFEVVDIDNYRIDQLLVTRLVPGEAGGADEGHSRGGH